MKKTLFNHFAGRSLIRLDEGKMGFMLNKCHTCGCRRSMKKDAYAWLIKAWWYFSFRGATPSNPRPADTLLYCQRCGDSIIQIGTSKHAPGFAVKIDLRTGELIHDRPTKTVDGKRRHNASVSSSKGVSKPGLHQPLPSVRVLPRRKQG